MTSIDKILSELQEVADSLPLLDPNDDGSGNFELPPPPPPPLPNSDIEPFPSDTTKLDEKSTKFAYALKMIYYEFNTQLHIYLHIILPKNTRNEFLSYIEHDYVHIYPFSNERMNYLPRCNVLVRIPTHYEDAFHAKVNKFKIEKNQFKPILRKITCARWMLKVIFYIQSLFGVQEDTKFPRAIYKNTNHTFTDVLFKGKWEVYQFKKTYLSDLPDILEASPPNKDVYLEDPEDDECTSHQIGENFYQRFVRDQARNLFSRKFNMNHLFSTLASMSLAVIVLVMRDQIVCSLT